MTKLTIIGSGSMVFTRRIVTDLLLMEEFSEMEISLMDIDPKRLRISELIVKAIANEIGVKPNITCEWDWAQLASLTKSTFSNDQVWIRYY